MTSRMEERYEGNFLDALDLPEGSLGRVTISAVADPGTERDTAGKVIKNAILAFEGKQKRLIINKTNFKNLKAMFGGNPAQWVGKTIMIQRRYLDASRGFGQQNCLCIRIIPPTGTPILKSAANYMGSPTPYGEDGKPTRPRQQEPQQPVESAPATEPAPQPAPESLVDQFLVVLADATTYRECDTITADFMDRATAEEVGILNQHAQAWKTQHRAEKEAARGN